MLLFSFQVLIFASCFTVNLKQKSRFVGGLTFLMGQWHEIFKLERFFLFIIITKLKVDGNEKRGGSGMT
jgi:hypothetical protein